MTWSNHMVFSLLGSFFEETSSDSNYFTFELYSPKEKKVLHAYYVQVINLEDLQICKKVLVGVTGVNRVIHVQVRKKLQKISSSMVLSDYESHI